MPAWFTEWRGHSIFLPLLGQRGEHGVNFRVKIFNVLVASGKMGLFRDEDSNNRRLDDGNLC